MKKLYKFLKILIVISVCITITNIYVTYAKYSEGNSTNVSYNIKKWLIKINTYDIMENNEMEIYIKPTILNNSYVNENVIVPSTIGYFNITLDYSNTDVDFSMKYEFEQTNTVLNNDFKLLGYIIVDVNEEITSIDKANIKSATDNILYSYSDFVSEDDESTEKKVRILLVFEWNDDENNDDKNNDDKNNDDTLYSVSEKNSDGKSVIKYKLHITFKQENVTEGVNS